MRLFFTQKMVQWLELLWVILISLKTAVTIISLLTLSLMMATFIESAYGTKTAQHYVYRAVWFYCILAALGMNILAVAISRYPWKAKHTPFLMAHAGILMILFGSAITATKGLDGSMRLTEGEVSSAVELESQVLSINRGDAVQTYPMPWLPEQAVASFKPIVFSDLGVQVDRFIPNAEAKVSFLPVDDSSVNVSEKDSATRTGSAIRIKILGAPMGGAPEFWLWNGDVAWSTQRLGPARFLIRSDDQKDLNLEQSLKGLDLNSPEARFDFVVAKNGQLRYETISIRGEKKSGLVKLNPDEPTLINPGWRMPIQVQVKKFIVRAQNKTDFVPSLSGSEAGNAPMPAIRLSLISEPSIFLWLGLGDRADLALPNEKVSVGYYPKRVTLPFAIRLKQFEVKNDPGTQNAASYSSDVQVVKTFQKDETELQNLPTHNISMNEPLKESFYTFYQASFIPDFPRAVTSVLTVNHDPGRSLKYWGSLLLVLGSLLLFAMKSYQSSKSKKQEPSPV